MAGQELTARITAAFLKALVITARPGARQDCKHDDPKKWTLIDGRTVHCACGVSLRSPQCQHIRVSQLLPKVWQCVDCLETRGEGGEA